MTTETTPAIEAMERLLTEAPDTLTMAWLDDHKDSMVSALAAFGRSNVCGALDFSRNTVRTWERRRGLLPQSLAKEQEATPPVDGTESLDTFIPLDVIEPNPWQSRKTMDPEDLLTLADSIDASGLLQVPIGRRREHGVVQLAFGHRRVEAIRLLASQGKWQGGVPIVLRDLTDQQMAIFALEENAKRKDINPLEQLQSYRKVIDDGLMNVSQLADSVGQARPTVSNNLRILNLTTTALEEFRIGNLGTHAAKDLLCFWEADHSHGDEIDAVIKAIKNTYTGVPDWSIKSVRQHIHNRVSGSYAQAWRPLDKKALSGYGHPNFDVESFKQEFPSLVHNIPHSDGEGSMAWTCNVREWRRLQSAATRAATKAQDEPTKTQALSEKDAEVYMEALAHDPVVQAIRAGEQIETAPAEVPTGTPEEQEEEEDPKGEQYKLVNEWAARWLTHEERDLEGLACPLVDSPEDCPVCGAEEGEDIFAVETLRYRLGLDLLSDIEIKRAWERAADKAIAGEEEESAATPTIPDVDTNQVADWQTLQENLGTRARFLQLWKGRRPGFLKDLDSHDLPRGFPDLEECRTRCTWGAVYGQEREGSRHLRLYCTNQNHFNEKKARGEELWRAKLQERRQRETDEDQAVAQDVSFAEQASFLRSIVLTIMAEQRWQEVVKPGGWNEEDLFYEYSTSARIRELLDMEPVDLSSRERDLRFVEPGYGSDVRPEVAAKVAALDLIKLQELLGQLVAFTRRKLQPVDSHPSPSFADDGDWDDEDWDGEDED